MSNRRPNQRRQSSAATGFASGRSISDHSVQGGIVRSPLIEQLIEPLLQQGHEEKALAQLRLLQQSQCRDPRIGVLMGNLLCNQQNFAEAACSYHQALLIDPGCIDALVNLGNLAAIKGDSTSAAQFYERAALINPSYLPLLANYSNLLLETCHHLQVQPLLAQWAEADPTNPEPLIRLGFCLLELDDWYGARQALNRALVIHPHHAHALARLATLELFAENNIELALDLAKQAQRSDPTSPQINLILGSIYLAAARYGPAVHYLELAESGSRSSAQALHNLAFAYFGLSQREKGYQYLECRAQLADPIRPHAASRYTAFDPSDQSGQLVLLSEQGFGDTLQFIRYAPWLIDQGLSNQITAFVQPQLVPLLRFSFAHQPNLLIKSSDQAPASLQHLNVLPLLSCPHQYGEHPNNSSLHRAYIQPPPKLVDIWHDRICKPNGDHLIVAICWQGNPRAERTHNRGRSMPLTHLLRLAEHERVKFVSLQKGPGSEQLTPELRSRFFVDCQDEITAAMPFEDSAAILSCCDLMITTDTGMAHLCGALGKPLWLLLSHRPDWRWGPHGECTFWYPDVSMFQQPTEGDWSSVIDTVQIRLLAHLTTLPARKGWPVETMPPSCLE